MKKISTILTALVSIALIATYFIPMWSINLDAPQYPEGLGFKIFLDKMEGDLHTINGLNHYIGMKTIEPDSFKELKLMPYFVGFIICLGFLVAIFRKKWLLYTWSFIFITICIVGCIDFYLWEYDYGHNLNPHAAIIVPGMSYQPPLFGDKQLLNFIAHSYPDVGGIIIIISVFVSAILSLFEIRNAFKKIPAKYSSVSVKTIVALFAITNLFSSCTHNPEPINYRN